MYLFKPYPGDVPYRGSSLAASNWDAALVTVDGAHAERAPAAHASAAFEGDSVVANQPLLVQGRKYLDLADQLTEELASVHAGEAQAGDPRSVSMERMRESLNDCKSGLAQVQTALVRLNRLREAVPSLATSPRALTMFDHVLRQHECGLKQTCDLTYAALGRFAEAIDTTVQHHRPAQAADSADRISPSVMALHHLIAAVKGLLAMIMATVMAPHYLARHASPHASDADPLASNLRRAASALREVREQCADMMAKLRDAQPGDDPDFAGMADDGPDAGTDAKVRAFFALFELLNLIEDKPPVGPATRQETRILTMKPAEHARMTEELAQALEAMIARYPADRQDALLDLYKLAFPGRAAAMAIAIAEPVSLAAQQAPEPAPSPQPAPVIPETPAPTPPVPPWIPSMRTLGACLAGGLLYVTLNLL